VWGRVRIAWDRVRCKPLGLRDRLYLGRRCICIAVGAPCNNHSGTTWFRSSGLVQYWLIPLGQSVSVTISLSMYIYNENYLKVCRYSLSLSLSSRCSPVFFLMLSTNTRTWLLILSWSTVLYSNSYTSRYCEDSLIKEAERTGYTGRIEWRNFGWESHRSNALWRSSLIHRKGTKIEVCFTKHVN
jgi:hypothetical protein